MREKAIELGKLLYEARLPLWGRIAGLTILLPLSAISGVLLVVGWSRASLISGTALVFVFLVGPFSLLDANRWVRFYERGIVARDWFQRARTVAYGDLTFLSRGKDLTIGVQGGQSIEIPRFEGDFDLIEELVQERRRETDGRIGQG